MKTRKLKFQKETIAKLESLEMVQGGVTSHAIESCEYCPQTGLNFCITKNPLACQSKKIICISVIEVCP
ncbi:MAG: hypothetical protein ACEPOV_08555 [Hyphomicrobiales bacterium]